MLVPGGRQTEVKVTVTTMTATVMAPMTAAVRGEAAAGRWPARWRW
ncbi:hypothetical protein PQR15_29325 [Streptomyces lydicus]|nr:hypothetical protein [Streptomyces lydicus]